MATKLPGKIERWAPWFLLVVIATAVLTLLWLKRSNPAAASVLAPVLAISVMGYAAFIASRLQRRLDEVQIASQGFAIHRGWIWGSIVTVLLLMLPPVTNWLVDLTNMQSTGSPDLSDRRTVRLALIYGFCLVVAVQTIGVFVASAIWWKRMGGIGERS